MPKQSPNIQINTKNSMYEFKKGKIIKLIELANELKNNK